MILDMGITLAMVTAADMAAGLAPMTVGPLVGPLVGLEDVRTVDRAPQHSQVPGQHQVCVVCWQCYVLMSAEMLKFLL